MKNIFSKLFGDDNAKTIRSYQGLVDQINKLEPTIKELADADFPKETERLKNELNQGKSLDDILPYAFALVREAAVRTLEMRHYDVQLIGGIVMHKGQIAEMRTGEGKTLVATLPVYLNALSGRGVHVITVNDYLAKRDADWMGQIYAFLGLSVAVINSQQTSYLYNADRPSEQEGGEIDEERDEKGSFKIFGEYLEPCSRQDAYKADITYGTNNEFGFDYLRDNTQMSAEGLVQREHAFAIVDEIDSILIDEARVPLILSRAAEKADARYKTLANVAAQLTADVDYTVDEKYRAISLSNEGIEKSEKLLGISNIYGGEDVRLIHHLENAVRAKAVFLRDRDYVIKHNQVVIIDPFTGRLQEGRRYSDGVHQAIEAKEGVEIQQESRTMASITYQNYFRFYDKLSGMTGTAATSREEFYKVYGLDVIEIPTNKPVARKDNLDLIFRTEKGKFKAVIKKIKELNEKGQPVLIGTASVEKNELFAAYLTDAGVPFQMLNAKNHEHEGEIIAQAGKKGAVTLATNMAGRGVDIKLGGNPTTPELEQAIKDLGGLFVIGTERLESRRIDNQLRGRSGRQGDPGETQFYISLEDTLARVFGGDRMKGLIDKFDAGKDLPEHEPIYLVGGLGKMFSRQIEKSQERYEGMNFDARKNTLSYDEVLSVHRNTIYERRRAILKGNQEFLQKLLEEIQDGIPKEAKEDIQAKVKQFGDDFWPIIRRLALVLIDMLWMQHLEVMDSTKRSVNLRAYGQREPIVEYKKEALRLYGELEHSFNERLVNGIRHLQVNSAAAAPVETPAVVKLAEQDLGRNDKVTVIKTETGEQKEVKFKKLDEYLKDGWQLK
jgi:preprotein translocase subunit SecA